MDVSRGMVERCRTSGQYDEVLLGSIQDISPGLSTYDHIICLSVLHFLSAPELSLVLARCFQLAQQSLTVSIEEIITISSQNPHGPAGLIVKGFNHLDEVIAFGVAPGWELARRKRKLACVSPLCGEQMHTTILRYEKR